MTIRVTIWNEGRHEKQPAGVSELYPEGLHGAISKFFEADDALSVRVALLDDPDCGLPDEVLNTTDVLFWWGHIAHGDVPDELVERVHRRVLAGMGMVFLHSAHKSKPFMRLMGTSGNLRWRDECRERVWCVNPSHPIAQGVPEEFVLDPEEMYGEYFDIPAPDELVFISWFRGGEVFRSGCTWRRGRGKVFYFRPGHELNPSYHNPLVGRILLNAAHWAAPRIEIKDIPCPWSAPLE